MVQMYTGILMKISHVLLGFSSFVLSLAAPCVPTYVVATTNCDTSITTVTWDSARGASRYIVQGNSTLGNHSTCTNTDTTCSFANLECGQNYTITVTAEDNNCTSLTSAPINVTTGTDHRVFFIYTIGMWVI